MESDCYVVISFDILAIRVNVVGQGGPCGGDSCGANKDPFILACTFPTNTNNPL